MAAAGIDCSKINVFKNNGVADGMHYMCFWISVRDWLNATGYNVEGHVPGTPWTVTELRELVSPPYDINPSGTFFDSFDHRDAFKLLMNILGVRIKLFTLLPNARLSQYFFDDGRNGPDDPIPTGPEINIVNFGNMHYELVTCYDHIGDFFIPDNEEFGLVSQEYTLSGYKKGKKQTQSMTLGELAKAYGTNLEVQLRLMSEINTDKLTGDDRILALSLQTQQIEEFRRLKIEQEEMDRVFALSIESAEEERLERLIAEEERLSTEEINRIQREEERRRKQLEDDEALARRLAEQKKYYKKYIKYKTKYLELKQKNNL